MNPDPRSLAISHPAFAGRLTLVEAKSEALRQPDEIQGLPKAPIGLENRTSASGFKLIHEDMHPAAESGIQRSPRKWGLSFLSVKHSRLATRINIVL